MSPATDAADQRSVAGDYPEHNKMHEIVAETQAAGEFIEWLSTQGLHLARNEPGHNFPRYDGTSLTVLLARWQGIDLDKIEAEKRQMLAVLRKQNEKRP